MLFQEGFKILHSLQLTSISIDFHWHLAQTFSMGFLPGEYAGISKRITFVRHEKVLCPAFIMDYSVVLLKNAMQTRAFSKYPNITSHGLTPLNNLKFHCSLEGNTTPDQCRAENVSSGIFLSCH